LLFIFCWLQLVLAKPVMADENFASSLATNYLVAENGMTTITHRIELKNKNPTTYLKQYALKVSSPDISQVKVKSNGEVLQPTVVSTDTQTSIGIAFPDQVVGEGKSRVIEVEYQHPDAAVVSGKVLEVLVPRLAVAREYDTYSVTLSTPKLYGQPTRVTPASYTVEEQERSVITRLNMEQGEGVVALFGTQQVFEMELHYLLQNEGSNPGIAQIALPPDTSLQKMRYHQLEPRPDQIVVDVDGNWIATYQVPPQRTLSVKALASILTTLEPFALPATKLPTLQLTQSQDYWPIDDAAIQETSLQNQTASEIYEFVVETLNYNYEALYAEVPRLGGASVLTQPDLATCQEYTDLFITMARANQIPARRITGYGYTQNPQLRPLEINSDILHAWPEYFDQATNQWKAIDPTWGDTTGGVNYFDQFDLNHITFAINGHSSTLPFPAGSYKSAEEAQTKDVLVSFGQDFAASQPNFTVSLEKKLLYGIPLPGRYELAVTNETGEAWYQLELKTTSVSAQSVEPFSAPIEYLLPYETKYVPLERFSNQLWQGQTSDLQLELSHADYQTASRYQTTQFTPLVITEGGQVTAVLSHPLAIPGLGIGCISLALISGSILVRGGKRRGPVRRKS